MEQKKRKKGLIIGGIAAGVVVVGLFMCWLMGFFGGISSVKAEEIARADAGLGDAKYSIAVDKEFTGGCMKYDVTIVSEEMLYNYQLNVRNGKITSKEKQSVEYGKEGTGEISVQTTDIGIDSMILNHLLSELRDSDPESYQILMVLADGLSERASAEKLNMPRNTFVYKKNQLLKRIRENF